MSDPTVIHDTFVLERDYPKAPEAVFAIFADPAKKRRWFVEGPDHDIQNFTMDFQRGGHERAAYIYTGNAPIKGMTLSTDTVFHDIVPGQRVVISSSMALDDKPISCALVTFELRPTANGTKLICTHQAVFFEGADGPKMRKGGWESLLDKLAANL